MISVPAMRPASDGDASSPSDPSAAGWKASDFLTAIPRGWKTRGRGRKNPRHRFPPRAASVRSPLLQHGRGIGVSWQAFQRLAQHLAPLAEGGERHRFERLDLARDRRRARAQFNHAGGDFRRRREGGRRHVEQDAGRAAPVGEHAEAAVSRRARAASPRSVPRPRAGTSAPADHRTGGQGSSVSQVVSSCVPIL